MLPAFDKQKFAIGSGAEKIMFAHWQARLQA